jgi:hypothetical protein
MTAAILHAQEHRQTGVVDEQKSSEGSRVGGPGARRALLVPPPIDDGQMYVDDGAAWTGHRRVLALWPARPEGRTRSSGSLAWQAAENDANC